MRLTAVFISHLHGDHIFGLFPMISTLGLMGRKRPLHIYAPNPFGEILEYHLRYFDTQLPYEVVWHELHTTQHELLFENGVLEVWSVPLRHRVPTAGFLFKEKPAGLNVRKDAIERYDLGVAQITSAKRGEDVTLESGEVVPNDALTYTPWSPRSYAYLSDTNYSGKAVSLVKGVDLLYHEATYAADMRREAKDRGHATTHDAARAAVESGAQRLLIGHFSSRYKDEQALVEALDNGIIAGAGLDVFAEEPSKNPALYTHPRVSVTPHIGGQTEEAQSRIGQEIVAIMKAFEKE
jgi:ribonuclease Z